MLPTLIIYHSAIGSSIWKRAPKNWYPGLIYLKARRHLRSLLQQKKIVIRIKATVNAHQIQPSWTELHHRIRYYPIGKVRATPETQHRPLEWLANSWILEVNSSSSSSRSTHRRVHSPEYLIKPTMAVLLIKEMTMICLLQREKTRSKLPCM